MDAATPEADLLADLLPRLFDALAASEGPLDFAPLAATAVAETAGHCCALWLLDRPTAELRLAASHHRDPHKARVLQRLAEVLPHTGHDGLLYGAAALHEPTAIAIGKDGEAERALGSHGQALLARRTGLCSLVLAPLEQGGLRLGLLGVGWSDCEADAAERGVAAAGAAARHIGVALGHLQRLQLTRQASQQLTLTSLRMRTILEAMPQGVVVADPPEGQIAFANRSLVQLLGREPAPYGRAVDCPKLLGLFHPSGERFRASDLPWMRSLRSAAPTEAVEMEIRRPDGSRVVALCSASPISDDSDEIVGAVALLQDITERKEFEQQQDEFLAMTAHELKTPITSVKGFVQLMLRRSQKEPGTESEQLNRRFLEMTDHQVNRMTRLIADLVDLPAIQKGRPRLRPKRFCLGGLARDVVTRMQDLAATRHLGITATGDTVVQADPDRIEQVLTNLISNSIQATGEHARIDVSVRGNGARVAVSLADDGPGMSPEVQKRAFERLYRGPERAHEGMGLGLYISKAIIDAHGGRIWVESEMGKGTVFRFSLPAASQQPIADG